jgi:glycopeptide antibiotics resistance protein
MIPTGHRGRRLTWLGFWAVAAVIVVVGLLLWPTAVDGMLLALVSAVYSPVGSGLWMDAFKVAGFLANVALFVPLALIIGVASRRWWLGVVVGVGTSVGSELVQVVLPGRNASVEDVIANSLGAGIGALIALAVVNRQRSRELDR